jgi:hypothetical protein
MSKNITKITQQDRNELTNALQVRGKHTWNTYTKKKEII